MRKTAKIVASMISAFLLFFSLSGNAHAQMYVYNIPAGTNILDAFASSTQPLTIKKFSVGTGADAYTASQNAINCTNFFNPVPYYPLQIQYTTSLGIWISYIETDSTSCGSGANTGNWEQATFYWNGINIQSLTYYSSSNPNGQPYFIEPYTPYNGSYASTSPTTFSAEYYNPDNTNYDTLTFDIIDLNTSSTTIQVLPTAITQSGTITETANVKLNPGDSYLWRPEAYLSTGSGTPLYGNWYNFVASSSVPITINTAYNGTIGTTTLPQTSNLLSFLNVPQLLETKFPFAYIFQIASGIEIAVSTSTYNTIPAGNFVWSGIGTGTTTFDFFSTTTIGYYLSPTLIGVWRAFLLVVLYVSFGYALYETARKHLSLK